MKTIVIEKYKSLPCSFKTFTIDGKKASRDDFGNVITSGLPKDGTCGCYFKPKMPTEEILEKYNLTLKEYSDICEELEEKSYVGSCGWCW